MKSKKQDAGRQITDVERNIVGRMKMGRNIALIGVFCPFFWIAVFSGATGQTLYANAIHSGIVIVIGLAILATYRLRLARYRKDSRRDPGIKRNNIAGMR